MSEPTQFFPGPSEGTAFEGQVFLSPGPFVIERRPVPQPTRVTFQAQQESIFLPCLHDEIEIPITREEP